MPFSPFAQRKNVHNFKFWIAVVYMLDLIVTAGNYENHCASANMNHIIV